MSDMTQDEERQRLFDTLSGDIRQQFHDLLQNRGISIYGGGEYGARPLTHSEMSAILDLLIDSIGSMTALRFTKEARFRAPREEATAEELEAIIKAGWNPTCLWPSQKPEPVEILDDRGKLWSARSQLASYVYGREGLFNETRPFIAASRSPGYLLYLEETGGTLDAQSYDMLLSQINFGRWGYPFDGVVYERFFTRGSKVWFKIRGSFNFWRNRWPDDAVLMEARRIILPSGAEINDEDHGDRGRE